MAAAPPLEGMRVLDLSRVLAGPFCTQLLADLGADVVKVERPGAGDETRAWGPPFRGGESVYFMSANRGKRSVAIDLADPRGRDLVLLLARTADVAIENFREGAAERLGIGREALDAARPGIVYCSIEGYGSGREPAGRPGYDFVIQAESGLMAITGPVDGEPSKAGVALVDVIAGLHAAAGILAAHARQARTGEGEHVRVSLLDAGLAALVNVGAAALVTGREPARHGNAHPSIAPYQTLRAADAELALAAPNDPMFRRVCEAIGRPELADDPRFAGNAERVAHREALIEALEAELARRPAQEWIDELLARGVPAGKVRGVREAFDAAAASGRAASTTVRHPTAGEVELPAGAIRLADTEPPAPAAPPL
ncbi:MAG TPA: CoA transferase, partial [Solirubrobacteraceae bacterium]|nr:CoA transferase [Solirubrobacteraceae bacterium]